MSTTVLLCSRSGVRIPVPVADNLFTLFQQTQLYVDPPGAHAATIIWVLLIN